MQDDVIKPWPNTYTYTKSLSERSLIKHRGDIPLLILRPAIIICAENEPVAGWTDSLAAAGALTLVFGVGLIRYLNTNATVRGDLIPVDYVSNSIIIGTAAQASKNCYNIVHCNSTHSNPVTWAKYAEYCYNYLKFYPL
jgi:fatty acyl-CoA reductase